MSKIVENIMISMVCWRGGRCWGHCPIPKIIKELDVAIMIDPYFSMVGSTLVPTTPKQRKPYISFENE